MVSDEEIVNGIESLLRQGTTTTTTQTLNGVIQQLEEKLGLDLSHKVGFIRDLLTTNNNPSSSSSSNSNSSSKDHFALQQQYPHPQPQFYNNSQQFVPSHFALPHHQFLQQFHHPEDVHFRYPTTQQFHHGFNPHLQRHSFNPNPNPHLQLQERGGRRNDGSVVTTTTTTVADAGPPETKKESASTGTKRRGGPGGLNKVCGVSPELQVIVGEPALPRTQIVKQLWAYIRKHNLQDPSNKRKIICNDELRLVFETDCTDMFKMNKLLAKHIIPLDPTKDLGLVSKRLKVETESATESGGPEAGPEGGTEAGSEGGTEAGSEGGTEAGLEGGTQAGSLTVIISDALARFFGTEEKEMRQSEAIRRVWEYIKVNQLEDDLNPMMIMCDPKLQGLFGCENVSALGISEMLLTHFSKQS